MANFDCSKAVERAVERAVIKSIPRFAEEEASRILTSQIRKLRKDPVFSKQMEGKIKAILKREIPKKILEELNSAKRVDWGVY